MRCYLPYSSISEFPIENIPFGVFSTIDMPVPRIGVAIGDMILDLNVISHLFTGPHLKYKQHVFKEKTLSTFMALPPAAWNEARTTIQSLLSEHDRHIQPYPEGRNRVFVDQTNARMHLPVNIGEYSCIITPKQFARNLARYEPSGRHWTNLDCIPSYSNIRHTSSIVISGTPIRRPVGPIATELGQHPVFGPSQTVDFMPEIGYFLGGPLRDEPIPVERAHESLFGFVLLNTWNATDIRIDHISLETLATRNWCTSMSPWIVTPMALEPFRVHNYEQNPPPALHLTHFDRYNFDIDIRVNWAHEGNIMGTTFWQTNYKYLYWTAKQHIAQHSRSRCRLFPGDLLSSGPIGEWEGNAITPILEYDSNGERTFEALNIRYMDDGDTITMTANARGNGFNVGFGYCKGVLEPSFRRN